MSEFRDFDDQDLSENVSQFYKTQEVKEVRDGVSKMLATPLPYSKYGDVDYNEDTRILVVNISVKNSEIKSAKKAGKLPEVKKMISRVVGGSISPYILANTIRLVIFMHYGSIFFRKSEQVLNCEIHNKRFDFMSPI